MSDIRWKDNPKLTALAGTERIPATSIAGGSKVGGGSVAAGEDIYIDLADIAAMSNKMPPAGTAGQVLKKVSNTSYDVGWADESGGGGGGGGGSINIPPDITVIDTFAGGVVSADWVKVDNGDSTKNLVHVGAIGPILHIKNTPSYGSLSFLQPLSDIGGALSIGEAFVTCVEYRGHLNMYPQATVLISDGTTYGSGLQMTASVCFMHAEALRLVLGVERKSGFNDRVQWVSDVAALWSKRVWLRLVLTAATTYRVDYSTDGYVWLQINSVSNSLTPTHAGFAVCGAANSSVQFAAEFLLFGRMFT